MFTLNIINKLRGVRCLRVRHYESGKRCLCMHLFTVEVWVTRARAAVILSNFQLYMHTLHCQLRIFYIFSNEIRNVKLLWKLIQDSNNFHSLVPRLLYSDFQLYVHTLSIKLFPRILKMSSKMSNYYVKEKLKLILDSIKISQIEFSQHESRLIHDFGEVELAFCKLFQVILKSCLI